MKLQIRLFGTLRVHASDYDPSTGLALEMPDGATVKDLLAHLGISEMRGAVVIVEGRTMETSERLRKGSFVNIFQTIQGG